MLEGLSPLLDLLLVEEGLVLELCLALLPSSFGLLLLLALACQRGASLITNHLTLGPYSSICLGSYGGHRGVEVSHGRGTPVVKFLA